MEDLVVELERSMAAVENVARGGGELEARLAAHRARIEELRAAILDARRAENGAQTHDFADGNGASDALVETPAGDMKSAVRAYKRELVERALAASAGDNTAAARRLGVHPKYLYQLIRELDATKA